jgi:glucosylceramidase
MRLSPIFAAALAAAACRSVPAPTASAGSGARIPVRVWLTTGDQRHLLEAQPAIEWRAADAAVEDGQTVIDIDPSRSFQEMVGFGAAITDASALLLQKLPTDVRERALQDLFGSPDLAGNKGQSDGGISLSFVRVPMGASDFSTRHYSYDDLPDGESDSTLRHFSIAPDRDAKLPILRRALAINPRLKVMASPWSPPAWMKTTNSLIKGTLQPLFYDSFADYFVRFIRAYQSEGVPIYAISLQNEPAFEPDNYPGMRLDPGARARVIANHLGPKLQRQGIRTMILDWDHNWDAPQQPLDVLADTAARKYVQGVAWHCYGGDVGAQSTVHDRYPDKDAYFSECSGGEWSPRFDENLKWFVNTLIIGSTRNWARGVLLWNLALDPGYGPHLGGCGNCRGVITIDTAARTYTRNVEYYALAHAGKFVAPGAVRIASSGGDSTLTHVAFRNPGNGSVAVVVLNSGATARHFETRIGARGFAYELPPGAVATFLIKI